MFFTSDEVYIYIYIDNYFPKMNLQKYELRIDIILKVK